ncbi:uncharacterized protein [Aegilops tauschii subsp. strangulata]|uniref:uncharacterized protein n=1 Tax=Aegilops tauschii subsp. strangulata TaxID=200361 RepID=UPI00098AC1E7|nr:uncharacterized protein LOC109738603 [Aegilops tauschii subsp. strangulata]
MAESTTIEYLCKFCRAVVEVFGPQYLRSPNAEDTTRILAQNEAREFYGMLGSIDCLHWAWKNCPFAWQGMYKGAKGGCSVCSNVFAKLVEGHAPPVNFKVNGRQYNKGYYLADGIYPRWSTFVKTISNPVPGGKNSYFAKCQEACRKDVEQAFGVLKSLFAVVRQGPLAAVDHQVPVAWAAFLNMRQEIRDPQVHQELQKDLVEHLWRLKGNA